MILLLYNKYKKHPKSSGKQEEKIGPGERNWVMDVPLGSLAPGKYTAEARLTTQPRQYSAVVSFEIVR